MSQLSQLTKKDFEALLVKEFPHLYADMYGSRQETPMAFGVAIGAGWYDIMYNMSHTLERLIRLEPEDKRFDYRMAQVKQKFGVLRVYLSIATEEMEMAVSLAEEVSSHTCEECGQPGKLGGEGWIITLCEDCFNKRDKSKTA